MGKDVQKNALPALFHFDRVRADYQSHVFSLSFDDVEIYGNSLYAGPYCGKINPPPSISSDNSLIISFQSDSSTVYEGFEIEYSCGNFSDFSSSCYGTKTNTQICCSSINQVDIVRI